jgi:hypothetical protein
MKVRIGSTWLAPGGFEATLGLSVNGQQITQEVEFFRALARQFYPRKNRSTSVSFSVTRSFETQREADAFILTHYNELPDSGDVFFYCGDDSDQQIVTLPGAVLDAVGDGSMVGTSVRYTYTVRGGIIRTDITPGPDPDMSNIRRAEVSLSSSDVSKDVTFSSPMPGVPVVTVNVSVPDDGDNIFATLKQSAINASGFSVYFSGPIPGSGYFLSYIAIS